jgi:serine/threonine protein kinase
MVKGPRIVGFHGVCMRPRFCIALEFCELGSLLHVLERQDIYWEWDKTFDLIRQVIQAVNDLHTWNPQIVHRDLKSLNLLVLIHHRLLLLLRLLAVSPRYLID